MGYIRKQTPIQAEFVTYYDCTKDPVIVGAPKNPGVMGNTNNPGLPINWGDLAITPLPSDPATLDIGDECPLTPIGKYWFDKIAPGQYVIEISRKGFLTRYGVVEVKGDDYLGHREILGGDVNGDATINAKDVTTTTPKLSLYGTLIYNATYDLLGDKRIFTKDIYVIQINLGAFTNIYKEADDWIK
jgi:hypothetical protein